MKYFFALFAVVAFGQITSANYDTNRTNATASETHLTPTNVNAAQFGLRCSAVVDDRVFAQPLFIPAVTVSGKVHDIFIVVTMNDSIYAFDAATCGPVWNNIAFDTPYADYPVGEGALYGALGCLSTPVVDVAGGKIYAVCDSATGPTWVVRAFSLTTGTILYSSALSGQVVGTGDSGESGCDAAPGPADTTSGANLLFFPRFEFQRAGLALSVDASLLYVGFGGLNDNRPYHGWLLTRNTSDLSAAAIWCASPNSWGGAVWMSGGAPAIDAANDLYVTTGNGCKSQDATAITNGVVKFDKNSNLLATWFPSDEEADDNDDADVSSDRFLLIPGTSFGVAASKDFNVYVLNTATMTLAQSAFPTCSGCTPSSSSGAYGMAFANNTLFVPTTADSLFAFAWNSGSSTFTTTPIWTQTHSFGFPGPAQIAGSCNGNSNCILWTLAPESGTHTTPSLGVMTVMNPATGSQLFSRSLGENLTKFAAPTIAGGRVFVSTVSNTIQVFGLAQAADLRGKATLRGAATIR